MRSYAAVLSFLLASCAGAPLDQPGSPAFPGPVASVAPQPAASPSPSLTVGAPLAACPKGTVEVDHLCWYPGDGQGHVKPPLALGAHSPLPAPSSIPSPLPSSAARGQIVALATGSSCAQVSWPGRGSPPAGYVPGMALSFARTLCWWRGPGTTVAGLIGAPLASSDHDALSKYSAAAEPGEGLIAATYALGVGLGMRESSGSYCEGYDISGPMTVTGAEAGPFQTSFDSIDGSRSQGRLRSLYAYYRAHPERCDLEVWQRGAPVSGKGCTRAVIGAGSEGGDWQTFTRRCPAFAAQYAMTEIRMNRGYAGPLNTGAAESRPVCRQLFDQVKAYVDATAGACDTL